MNDPHVESLTYRLRTAEHVEFDDPPAVEWEADAFRLRLVDGTLTAVMKEHHAAEETARRAVEPFLRAWELDVGLRHGRRAITFEFGASHVVDRNPPKPGEPVTVSLRGVVAVSLAATAKAVTVHSRYPAPPDGFAMTPHVETLWLRYQMYLDGKEPLASMAYACLTLLEGTTGAKRGSREAVCAKYAIERAVRDALGDLTSERGHRLEARKMDHGSTGVPLTAAERRWIEEAIKALIRRKAEYDADPTAARPLIRMADLPQL